MLLEVIALIVTAVLLYHYWAHSYWKRRNVFSIRPEPIFGNIRDLLFEKAIMANYFSDIHKKHKQHGIIGFYGFYKPMLLVSDPELVKKVLVTHFNSFSNGGFVMDRSEDPIMGFNPFAIKDHALWKEMRAVQSTMQTPLKLKELVPGIIKVAESMTEHIKKQNGPILIKDLATRFSVGSAAISAYGVEPNSFTDPEFGFMKHAAGEKLFDPTSTWSSFAPFFLPVVSKILKMRIISEGSEKFFLSMISSITEHRAKTQSYRGDLIDAVNRANQKKLEQNSRAYTPSEMAAHCLTFYIDSTTTLSELMCFVMLELAHHPDIQDKLRQEIQSVGKTIEDFDYDKIHSIAYLQMVIDETLRLHPVVSALSRFCTKDTTLNDVKISQGTKVFVSPYAFHHDPDYFPEPESFDPERFSKENRDSIVKYSFIPFGEGPRICLGMKYAQLALKLSLASILLKYRLLPVNGPQRIDYNPSSIFLLTAPFDVVLKFEEL